MSELCVCVEEREREKGGRRIYRVRELCVCVCVEEREKGSVA